MANSERTATVGGMIAEGIGILQRQAPLIGAFVLLALSQQALQYVAVLVVGRSGAPIISAIVTIAVFIATVMLLRELMVREGLATPGIPLRYGTYIGVSIVIGLAVSAGMVLLVVPGILLLLRWYLAPYFVVARGASFDESLAASRDATKGHRWAIFGVFLLLGLVYLVLLGSLMFTAGGFAAYSGIARYGSIGIVAVLIQAVLSGVTVAVLLGTFAALVDRANQFEDVFS